MKLIIVTLFSILISGQAKASGCGSYDNTRSVFKNELVAVQMQADYKVLQKTADRVTLQNVRTLQVYELEWEKSEKYEESINDVRIETRDLLFEEGNGCGPIFRCVTGQIRLSVSNASTGRSESFSFPVVNEVYTSGPLRYASESLLPVFGGMKLDTTSIAEGAGSSWNAVDPKQCGYGNW